MELNFIIMGIKIHNLNTGKNLWPYHLEHTQSHLNKGKSLELGNRSIEIMLFEEQTKKRMKENEQC
jgi:hypothetical protein